MPKFVEESHNAKNMRKGFLAHAPVSTKAYFFILSFIAGYMASSLIGSAIAAAASGYAATKAVQTIHTALLFAMPAWATHYAIYDSPLKKTMRMRKPSGTDIIICMAVTVTIIPFTSMLADISRAITFPEFMSGVAERIKEADAQQASNLTLSLGNNDAMHMACNILLMGVFTAICEEIFFRGTMQELLCQSTGAIWAVTITAFVFSGIHMEYSGFLSRMALGWIIGYAFIISRNICIPITMHALNNILAIILMQNGMNSTESMGKGMALLSGAAGLAATAYLMHAWRKRKGKD